MLGRGKPSKFNVGWGPSSNAMKDYKHRLGVALIDLNNSRKSESWSHDVDTTNESPPPCDEADAQYLDNSNCCRCVASLWYRQKEGHSCQHYLSRYRAQH